ncbi:MAG: CAP domain-containing protein [Candidatus Staskawiczbacteria bacterium]|nr:CAP domain-containing protein [Candidatus Staskawiczbacteria bacterium]
MKISKVIIFILIVLAFGAGVYFKDDAVRFYNGLGKQVQGFQKTDIGQTISEVSKQIFTSSPLNVGGVEKNVVLLQSKIISETNLQRQENGNLPALVENAKLNEAASAKAQDLFLNQYFEHVSPSGVGPGDLAQKYGYDYIVEGENLILGNFSSEKEVVQAWMDSPGHRANILNNRYTEIGVAMIKGIYKGQTVWIGVQEFGLPLSTCAKLDVALKNQIDLETAQLEILSSQIDEKKNQIDNTNHKSAPYNQMINDYNQLVIEYNSLAEKLKKDIIIYNDQVNIFNNCVAGI